MRCLSFLVVVAAIAAISNAQSSNTTAPAQSVPYPWFNPSPQFDPTGGNANAILAGIAMQMQYSQLYGKFILDFQSAQGWLQVSQGWVSMSMVEVKDHHPIGAFEEESGDEDKDLEEEDEEENVPDYDAIERQSEMSLMYVLKIMYLNAAQKLQDAKTSNYQNKANLALLVQAGAAQVFPQIIYLGYYLESIRLISSGITIQRQDAWNTWLLHEIMETDEFDNSRVELPPTFATALSQSRLVAMQLYYTEAMLDLQVYLMDYYMQSSLMSLAMQQPQQANAASSFVEEESTAEPNKPFFPFMMMGAMGGMGGAAPYLSYFSMYLKYFAVIMNFQAAQGLFTHAQLEASASDSANAAQYGGAIKLSACSALQQWAYLKFQIALLQMYGLFTGSPVTAAAANNNAANSFVQTDAAATQQ